MSFLTNSSSGMLSSIDWIVLTGFISVSGSGISSRLEFLGSDCGFYSLIETDFFS